MIQIVCVDSNYMHIYAFIVPHMHKNALKCIFGLHMQTYAHIYTYLYEDAIYIQTIIPIISIWEHSIDTWVTEVQPQSSLKKKMVEFMCHQQTISNPYVSKLYQSKPKITQKKRNLVPLTRPNRRKLSQPRKINVRKLPEGTQLNWASTIGKSLTQEAKDATQCASTNLDLIQGSQLKGTPSIPSPTSPAAHTKITELSKYCSICIPLGKICSEEFAMSSDWKEEDNQAKDKDQKQLKTHP